MKARPSVCVAAPTATPTPDRSGACVALRRQSKIPLINAGITSTDSAYGAQRVQSDVLQYHPDLVMIDFDVNDAWNSASTDGYQDLVQQVLAAPLHPAIVMLG